MRRAQTARRQRCRQKRLEKRSFECGKAIFPLWLTHHNVRPEKPTKFLQKLFPVTQNACSCEISGLAGSMAHCARMSVRTSGVPGGSLEAFLKLTSCAYARVGGM